MLFEQLSPYLPQHPLLHSLSILGVLVLFSLLAYYVTEKVILTLLTQMFRKTSTQLDDILVNRNIFNRLAYVVPGLIFYNFAYIMPEFTPFIQRTSLSIMALAGLWKILSSNSGTTASRWSNISACIPS